MAPRGLKASKGGELVDLAGVIARSILVDQLALQRVAADARRLMESDPSEAHNVLGIVAAIRGDADSVGDHYRIALRLRPQAIAWFNYSMSLAVLDLHEESFDMACRGLDQYPDHPGLLERAADAAVESGRFLEAESLSRRRDNLNIETPNPWRDDIRALSAAVVAGAMTEDGAAALINLMTKVQHQAGVTTIHPEIRRDGQNSFLYDRYVRCSPAIASELNWDMTRCVVQDAALSADPGRTFLVGFVGVEDGGNP